jgi:hypothetical protein
MSRLSERLTTLEAERGKISTAEVVELLSYRDEEQLDFRRRARELKAEVNLRIGMRLLELTWQDRRITSHSQARTMADGAARVTFRDLGFSDTGRRVMPYRLMKAKKPAKNPAERGLSTGHLGKYAPERYPGIKRSSHFLPKPLVCLAFLAWIQHSHLPFRQVSD